MKLADEYCDVRFMYPLGQKRTATEHDATRARLFELELLSLDARRLNDRPPLGNFGFLQI